MATVGNLFVTVGANTASLTTNLAAAEKRIEQFKTKVKGTGSAINEAFDNMKPISLGPLSLDIAGIKGKFEAAGKALAGNVTEAKALRDAVQRVAAAEQKVLDVQSLRKSAGLARATIGAAGFDPNRALPKPQDTERLTASIGKANEAMRGAAAAQQTATAAASQQIRVTNDLAAAKARLISLQQREAQVSAVAAGAKMPLLQRGAKGRFEPVGDLAAAKANNAMIDAARERHQRLTQAIADQQIKVAALTSQQAKGVGAIGKATEAQERMRVATERLTAAKAALAKAEAANAKLAQVSAAVSARGFDPSKAIKLPDLNAAKAAVESAKMEQSLASAALRAASLRTALLAVGGAAAAGAAAVGALTMHTIRAAKEMGLLEDSALRLGTSTDRLQDINNSMRQLGAAPEAAETAILRMSVKLEDAAAGGEEAVQAFEAIGLSMAQLDGKDAAEQFNTVLTAIRNLTTQQERVKALREIFGRGGVGIASAVNRGPAEVAQAQVMAEEVRIPAETVTRLAYLDDTLVHLKEGFHKISMMLAGAFSPALEEAAHHLSRMMAQDPESMASGMQSLAMSVAVVADVLNIVVGALRFVFNLIQAIAQAAAALVAGALGMIVKAIEWIIWGLEKISGSDLGSAAVGEFADAMLGAAQGLTAAAGSDVAEAFTGAAAHMKFGASRAVADGIENGYTVAQQHIGENPLMLKTKVQMEAEKELQKEMERKTKEIESILSSARDKANTLARGEVGQQRAKLQEAGASQSQLMEFDSTQRIIAINQAAFDLEEKRKQNAEQLVEEMKELAEAAATVNMTEAEILARKMTALGATSAQVAEAQRLADVLAAGEAQDKFADYMAGQQQALDKLTGNTEDLIRAELEQMGLVGAALEQALQQAVAMNAQIAQAEKDKAAQEEPIKAAEAKRQGIEDTVADLRLQAAQLGMTNAEKVADKLRREGATEAQIAEAVALQTAIDKFDKAADITDTTAGIDTALGNIKVGMPADAFDATQQAVRLSEQQLAVLKEIETLLEGSAAAAPQQISDSVAAVAASATDMSENAIVAATTASDNMAAKAGAGTAIPAMDRVMTDLLIEERRQTALLTTIANNTGAFAGVLT